MCFANTITLLTLSSKSYDPDALLDYLAGAYVMALPLERWLALEVWVRGALADAR